MTIEINRIDWRYRVQKQSSLLQIFPTQKLLGQFLVLSNSIFVSFESGTLLLPELPLLFCQVLYDVFMRLVSYFINGRIWPHLLMTTQEILAGFVLGSVLGLGFGTLVSESDIARKVIMPYIIVTQALPKFALAPMLVIWFGFGMAPKVIIAALIAFFPLVENTFMGLTTTPQPQLRTFSCTPSIKN